VINWHISKIETCPFYLYDDRQTEITQNKIYYLF